MGTNLKTLYVENFPLETTEETLHKLFNYFGKIKRVELPTFASEHPLCKGLPRPKTKGYAFIEYDKQTDADKACNFFNTLENIMYKSNTDYVDTNNSLRTVILDNLEFKNFRCLRVMSKEKFTDMTRRYNEQRLISLIEVAKLLVV